MSEISLTSLLVSKNLVNSAIYWQLSDTARQFFFFIKKAIGWTFLKLFLNSCLYRMLIPLFDEDTGLLLITGMVNHMLYSYI